MAMMQVLKSNLNQIFKAVVVESKATTQLKAEEEMTWKTSSDEVYSEYIVVKSKSPRVLVT